MQIQQIRNATLVVQFHHQRFLIDPWLVQKESMPGFEGAVHADVRQPRTELPLSVEEILKGLDAVILTHFHPDHFDELAVKLLDKKLPFFVQDEADLAQIKAFGFQDVRLVSTEGVSFNGLTLTKTRGQHGKRDTVKPICDSIGMPYDAMGVVFRANDEKTLYLAGDTIDCPEVRQAIQTFKPEVMVLNSCGAMLSCGEKLIMDAADVLALATDFPEVSFVASHMDTVSHLTVTRQDLQHLNLKNLLIPSDGEILNF